MTTKPSNITVLLVGYLFALATVSAAGEEKEKGGFGNFGDLGKTFSEGGLNSMFKSVTDGGGAAFNDFMSSFSGPKVLNGNGNGQGATGEKRDNNNNKENAGGFMGVKDPMEFFKLMLNPMEFMTKLAKEFKLDRTEFTQAVGRGMDFGMETALQPPIVCIKIIEKVFVPDACGLKFICDTSKQMAMFKDQMPKFPDSYFDGASTARAVYHGASGRECEQVYTCGGGEGPKLKTEFAGLKEKFSGSEQGDSGDYAASQRSQVRALGPGSARRN